MAEVELVRVSKRFRDGTLAVSDLSMQIEDGEFLVLVGPSGCGKSTALRMIAGLETVTAGEVRIAGRRVNEVSPAKRDIAMVFQNYALYPHMTVRKNLEIGLKLRGMKKPERREKVAKIAAMLGLEPYLSRRPMMLSGGQRQRVAMGRAIVRDPAVFLLDEPLSNLDAKLRMEVRAEIKLLQSELRTTTLFVTHDQVEALTMAHRIAVLRKGVLQQIGSPDELFATPDNLFVAGFIGSPPMNFLRGSIVSGADGDLEVRYGTGEEPWVLPQWAAGAPFLRSRNGLDVVIGVRPEHLTVTAAMDAAPGAMAGTVRLLESLGSDTLVYVDVKAPPLMVDQIQEALAADDEDSSAGGVTLTGPGGYTRLCVRLPESVHFALGEEVRVALARGALHGFDLQSGRRLGSVEFPRSARPAGVPAR